MTRTAILAVLVLLALCRHAEAQVSVVSSASAIQNNEAPATLDVVLTGVQAGDAIVACGVVEGTDSIAIADSAPNSYTLVADVLHGSNFPRVRMAYALNVASGTTTVTMTLGAANYRALFAVALRNVPTSSAADGSNTNSGNGTVATTGSVTPTVDGAIVGCLGSAGGATITEASGWTLLQESENGCCSSGGLVSRLTTPAAYTAQWDLGWEQNWVGIAFAIKASGGGGGGTGHRARLLMGIGE